ncbi:hypothetical protein HanIR_Chr07g0325131 [Helianthus annuus]|nr:hypothetical protein HanIR_Chr07g0325131 [Helianthus annuus]
MSLLMMVPRVVLENGDGGRGIGGCCVGGVDSGQCLVWRQRPIDDDYKQGSWCCLSI